MKERLLTAAGTVMMAVPWTILPIRAYIPKALESPAAESMISCCAAFMIFSGIFSVLAYTKGNARNLLMKICLVVNGAYAAFGILCFVLMTVS